MYQIVKTTSADSLEQRIDGALRQVCAPERLGRYTYTADLLTASCRDLIGEKSRKLWRPDRREPRLAWGLSPSSVGRASDSQPAPGSSPGSRRFGARYR